MAAPLVPPVLLWFAGLLLGERLPFHWLVWSAFAALAAVLGFRAARRSSGPTAGLISAPLYRTLLLLALLTGAARAAANQHVTGAGALASYNDRGVVQVQGIVTGYPETRAGYTRYEIESREIQVDDEAPPIQVRGRLLVNLAPYPAYGYGDAIELTGELVTPPVLDGFDYRAFLSHKGIYSLMRRAEGALVAQGQGSAITSHLFALRRLAEQTIGRLLPEPHASLLSGILLGIESGIPEEVMEAFNVTGTTHVLVISGSNIAILSAIFLFAGRRLLGQRWGTSLAIATLVLYVLMVGADPPVVRAAIMGILTAVALLLRRETVALNSLAFAAWGMTALHPGQLYDAGFQLSALATLGLIVLVPPLDRAASHLLPAGLSLPATGWAPVAVLRDGLILTIAAQIMTTPLIAGTFGRLSLVSLLANLLILPVQPAILISGAMTTLAGALWLPLGKPFAVLAYAAISWTISMVEWTAAFPFASVQVTPVPPWLIWGFYAAGGAAWLLRGRSLHDVLRFMLPAPVVSALSSRRSVLLWAGALLVALLPWWFRLYQPDGRLHLYMLDVGQGDALFIVTPDGKQVLVDGGPEPVSLLSELGARMAPWDRSLDLLVLTHADADHLGGLPELLNRYEVSQVVESGHPPTTPLYTAWQEQMTQRELTPLLAAPGQRWQLGSGAVLEVVAPVGPPFDESNDNSVVLRLLYGSFCALLTGDIEVAAETRLLANDTLGQCQVLKVAHHGSNTSSTSPLLERLAPRYALISSAIDNRFGHPAPEVLERLQAAGARVFRTDQHGTIHLTTDGTDLWVETEQKH